MGEGGERIIYQKKVLGGIALRDHPHITSPPRGEGGPPKGDTSIHYVVKRVTRGGQKIPKWR